MDKSSHGISLCLVILLSMGIQLEFLHFGHTIKFAGFKCTMGRVGIC